MAYTLVEQGTQSGANGNPVTTANTSLDTVTVGASNTITFSNATPYLSTVFIRQVQTGANQNNAWWDWGSNLTDPGWRMNFRWSALPAVQVVILRFFDGVAGAGTNIGSMAITTGGRLTYAETTPGMASTQTGVLTANVWYTLLIRYVVSTGAFTINIYLKNGSTLTASITGTMTAGYTFRSARMGISTASALITLDWDFADYEVGSGGFPARNDVTATAPVVTPDAAKDAVAGASVSVHASATVSGDTIGSFTGVLTRLDGGTAPALSGTATGIGTATANLTQTFTPTVGTVYTWSPTAQSNTGGLNSAAQSQLVYVSPVIGDPVPILSVTKVSYISLGAGASDIARLTDGDDGTGLESPSAPDGTAYVDVVMGPYGMSGIKVNPRGLMVGTGSLNRRARIYKTSGGVATGSPVFDTSYALGATATTPDVLADGPALAALSQTDRRAICWRFSDYV